MTAWKYPDGRGYNTLQGAMCAEAGGFAMQEGNG
jgi:hypothetical protein